MLRKNINFKSAPPYQRLRQDLITFLENDEQEGATSNAPKPSDTPPLSYYDMADEVDDDDDNYL